MNDDKWIYAIESYFNRDLLSSFFVDNKNDRCILYSIMKEVIPRGGRRPTVHCSTFQDRVRNYLGGEIGVLYDASIY